MKSNANPSSRHAIDGARRVLCAYFAQTLRDGSSRMRIRLHTSLGAAWFYEHHHNTWHKQEFLLEDPALIQAVTEELVSLSSKPHGDIVQVTHHSAADWQEIDIQFLPTVVEQHLGDKLESYLTGLLFGDHHDSNQDSRRDMHSTSRHGAHQH